MKVGDKMGAGVIIKEILREKKMTIKQLSEISGISVNTLYSITKRDSERIDSVIARRIASALDVSVAELYSEVAPKGPVEGKSYTIFLVYGNVILEPDSSFAKLVNLSLDEVMSLLNMIKEQNVDVVIRLEEAGN